MNQWKLQFEKIVTYHSNRFDFDGTEPMLLLLISCFIHIDHVKLQISFRIRVDINGTSIKWHRKHRKAMQTKRKNSITECVARRETQLQKDFEREFKIMWKLNKQTNTYTKNASSLRFIYWTVVFVWIFAMCHCEWGKSSIMAEWHHLQNASDYVGRLPTK